MTTGAALAQSTPADGSVLPFPAPPMAGVTKQRMRDSIMKWPAAPQRLPADAPNILIVMLDDIGFGVTETFGGDVHTPTLTRLAREGISYNTLSHDIHLLADAGGDSNGAQPHARGPRGPSPRVRSRSMVIQASCRLESGSGPNRG